MSHKKHKHTNYSRPQETTKVEPVVVETTIKEDDVTPVIVEPEVKPVIGIVTGCEKLRVREQANANATVVCEIKVGSEVMIDEEESAGAFYKVCTGAGVEGFCMKDYIVINQ